MSNLNSNANAIVLPEYETLVNSACLWEYGSFHSHDEISQIIYLKYTDRRYRNAIAKANNVLIEHGKMLESVRGKGYVVVKPDDYLKVSIKHNEKARKQIDKAHNVLENAPTIEMSEEARLKHRRMYDRSCSLQAMLHGGLKEMKVLGKPKVQFSKKISGGFRDGRNDESKV